MDIVAIPETTELFLAGCVPAVKPDFAAIGGKIQGTYFYSDGGCKAKRCVSAQLHMAKEFNLQFRLSEQYQIRISQLWYVRSYFFSNSPVKWRFTNVVLPAKATATYQPKVTAQGGTATHAKQLSHHRSRYGSHCNMNMAVRKAMFDSCIGRCKPNLPRSLLWRARTSNAYKKLLAELAELRRINVH